MPLRPYTEWEEWLLEHKPEAPKKTPIHRDNLDYAVTYFPMTDNEIQMIQDLSRCIFLPGSYNKRFVKSMVDRVKNENTITQKQGDNVRRLHHRFRKQISRFSGK